MEKNKKKKKKKKKEEEDFLLEEEEEEEEELYGQEEEEQEDTFDKKRRSVTESLKGKKEDIGPIKVIKEGSSSSASMSPLKKMKQNSALEENLMKAAEKANAVWSDGDDRTVFVNKVVRILVSLGVSRERIPEKFTLAAAPQSLRALSPNELELLVQQFVEETKSELSGDIDTLWKEFALQNAKKYREDKAPTIRKPKTKDDSLEGRQVTSGILARSVFTSMPAPPPPSMITSTADHAVSSSKVKKPLKMTVSELLESAKEASELLEESDSQLRAAMNVVATSKRRILDLDGELRNVKTSLRVTERQLSLSQTQNRDLRVKMLYDEREHKKQMETMQKQEKEGYVMSPEAQAAMMQVSAMKQELVQLCPLFPETLRFKNVELIFSNEKQVQEKIPAVRMVEDCSGKRWLVWSDLKLRAREGTFADIIARSDAIPTLNEKGRLIERLFCFRPFGMRGEEPTVTTAEMTDVLVSLDWPKFGGSVTVVDPLSDAYAESIVN